MKFILYDYQVNDPTWFYLSLLLILAVYFRFGRIWSLRNADLLLMLSISPALLFLRQYPAYGSLCLLTISLLLVVRTLFDGYFTRRPKLPQNMNSAGMAFLCASAMLFLGSKVLTDRPGENEFQQSQQARQLVKGLDSGPPIAPEAKTSQTEAGPGTRLIYAALAATPAAEPPASNPSEAALYFARIIALLAHLAVISGLVCVGYYHMGDTGLGLAMAALYLLLPCTTYEVGRVNHVFPAALIIWAFVAYRRVIVAGALLGLACGTLFFPIFLLPLWTVFYGRKGYGKFMLAVGGVTLVMVGGLWLLTGPAGVIPDPKLGFFNWTELRFSDTSTTGFWSTFPTAYRIPTFVTFLTMVVGLSIWPRYKDLATLMSSSAAIVIATQLWYPPQGSVYVLWYLPLFLMVVFRPPLHYSAAPDSAQSASTVTTSVEPRSAPVIGSSVHKGTAFL